MVFFSLPAACVAEGLPKALLHVTENFLVPIKRVARLDMFLRKRFHWKISGQLLFSTRHRTKGVRKIKDGILFTIDYNGNFENLTVREVQSGGTEFLASVPSSAMDLL